MTQKIKTTPKMKTTPKNEDNPKNEDDPKNEFDFQNEDDLKNEDDLYNKDKLKNEEDWVKFPFKRVSLQPLYFWLFQYFPAIFYILRNFNLYTLNFHVSIFDQFFRYNSNF